LQAFPFLLLLYIYAFAGKANFIWRMLMKAITYEGIKDVKVKNVGDPKIKNEYGYAIFDEKKNNCIKVILKP
jgi:hypothetical protein